MINIGKIQSEFSSIVSSGYPRVSKLVIGTSTAGYTASQVDYLCDGTADQAEFIAAMNSLRSGGGQIIVLNGTYNFSGIVTLYSGVSLCGSGLSTNIITSSGFFYANGVNDLLIKNINFDFNSNTGDKNGIEIINSTNIKISDCKFSNLITENSCIYFRDGVIGAHIYNCCTNNCRAFYFGYNNTRKIKIYNNIITNSLSDRTTVSSPSISSYTGSSRYQVLSNVFINGSGNDAVTLDPSISSIIANNSVSGYTDPHNCNSLSVSNSSSTLISSNLMANNMDGVSFAGQSNANLYDMICNNLVIRGTGIPSDYVYYQGTISSNNYYSVFYNNMIMGKDVDIGSLSYYNTYSENKWN